MTELTRRRLLQGATVLGAGAVAAALVGKPPPAVALGACPPLKPAKIEDLDHIIVLMKENRSFDHYFGTLRGVRGFADPGAMTLAGGASVFEQPDSESRSGRVLPFRLDTLHTSGQRIRDLDHSWEGLHGALNGGKMDRWLPTRRAANGDRAPFAMGFLAKDDLPFYYALADAFTVCDAYHASVLGPTHPNRYMLMTGTIDPDRKHGGPARDNRRPPVPYSWETYPERLECRKISWRVYHDLDDYGCNVLKYFPQYAKSSEQDARYDNALRNRPFYELLWDLRTGNIPQVTWIVPPSDVSEHPDWLPAAGEHHTRMILEALWSNPALWAKTALILNYDENDGFFDHVVPPLPDPGTPGEFVDGVPVGLGFRVPCIVISPFSRGGYVCSETFDHTSTLRLIEARFGVEVPNLSPWRRRTCGDLTRAFGFGDPARLDVPTLPDTAAALRAMERHVMAYPKPAVPDRQELPLQEPGTRPRRA